MSGFGWSMPPGAWESTLPGEEQEGPIALKCQRCGRFVCMKETRVEPWEDSFINDDPRFGPIGKKVILYADVDCYYACSKCGEIKDPIPVFA